MKRRLIVFIIVFTLNLFFIWDFAIAKDIIIKEKSRVLLNLSNPKVSKLIKSWDLKIHLIWNSDLELIEENNKIKFYINRYKSFEKWKIQITYKWKIKFINYILDYNPKVFNIRDQISSKGLQNMPLSCEISVASDIISYLNSSNVTESNILSIIDKSMYNESAETFAGKKVWWNPDKWFVWNIDYFWESKVKPTQRGYTWYWVYEKPMSKIYNMYWLSTRIINIESHNQSFSKEKHLSLLLESLTNWSMVQLWGDWCTDPKFEDWIIEKDEFTLEYSNDWYSWKNFCTTFATERKLEWYYEEDWEYKKHIWLIWEHSFYLLWFEWEISNPEKIIVWDSDTWYHKYPLEEWMRKWWKMNYKSIIISKLENTKNSKLIEHYKTK